MATCDYHREKGKRDLDTLALLDRGKHLNKLAFWELLQKTFLAYEYVKLRFSGPGNDLMVI